LWRKKDRIVVTLQQIYPNCAIFFGKAGAVWIYTAPTLILILKYENIKFKKIIPSGRGPTTKL
jgi:hypothetical protein